MEKYMEMSHDMKKNFYFESCDEKTRIHAVKYTPKGEPKGVIQIIHGMNDYIGRYECFAEYLCNNGFVVYGHDHLGHGDTAQSYDDYGYFTEKEGNRVIIKDVNKLMIIAKREYPDLPYYMYGHSMGSFVLRQFLCIAGDKIDGAIIGCTGNQPRSKSVSGIALTVALAKIKGWKYRSIFVSSQVFLDYNKHIKPQRTAFDWVCGNNEVVDRYVKDPQCMFTFTLNAYNNFFKIIASLYNDKYVSHMPKKLPILFLAGEQDPVGNYGKAAQELSAKFKQLGMIDVEHKIYKGMRHEILNEIDKYTVYDDVLSWIDSRMKASRRQK